MTIGLALSGGGFRASAFHLGVIEGLRESGLLGRIDEVAGVSGGSIVAAHLVDHWADYTATPQTPIHTEEEVKEAEKKFLKSASAIEGLTQRDVRNRVLAGKTWRSILIAPLFFESAATGHLLEQEYVRLFQGRTFYDLADGAKPRPHLSVLATSLNTGQLVSFHSDGVSFWPEYAGRENNSNEKGTSLARAVAASAAFPLLSRPIELKCADLGIDVQHGIDHWLTDGGIYDNLGAVWLAIAKEGRDQNPLDYLIVSDAGRPFDWASGGRPGLFGRNMRAIDLSMWRLAEYDFAKVQGCVTIGVRRMPIEHKYLPATVGCPSPKERLKASRIPTDLNGLTDEQVRLLRKHGKHVALEILNKNPIP